MVEKCAICGKSVSKWVLNSKHPEKRVCLDCLNGLVFNAKTLTEEMEPITKAFMDAFSEIKKNLENSQK